MTPRQVVETYLTHVLGSAGDGAEADRLVASAELRQRAARLRRAFPDLEVEPVVLLGEMDLVACHFLGRGTHLGVYQGVPATGRAWEARCTAVYRVAGERIVEGWVTWDSLSLMEQLEAIERVATVSA
jgi:predicted ester cyclase